jgi:hypothetical protein
MIDTRFALMAAAAATALLATPLQAHDDPRKPAPATAETATGSTPAWVEAEHGILRNHVQLTTGDRFHKAGEGYISPNMKHFVFQAVPVPPEGEEPQGFYNMYLADLAYDRDGLVAGLKNIRRISPAGSANTCGWFDPNDEHLVYFCSTIEPPTASNPPGYNRDTGRYKWMFPPEMRIVKYDMRDPVGEADSLELVTGDTGAYQAENALSPDGRHAVYCNLHTGDGDLYVLDFETDRNVCVVCAKGYDGGPFFSPEGRRLCYRSDRYQNNLLQIFVADLEFDEDGGVIGMKREYQLTDNSQVNWAPFWHPDGRHLIYTTSEMGHHNYEVFIIDADPGDLPGSNGSIRYGTKKRRVTHAARADVLPIFSPDGRWMTWTSQRGPTGRSQLWIAEFIMPIDPDPARSGGYDPSKHREGGGAGHDHRHEHGTGEAYHN